MVLLVKILKLHKNIEPLSWKQLNFVEILD